MSTHSIAASLTEWSADSTARLTVTAPSIDAALAGALQAILDVAGGRPVGTGPDRSGSQSISAPIRGQGASVGTALQEMANDLLAQLDANGTGLTVARLDGVLATDDDGYTAWGYVLGEAGGGTVPVGLSIPETPEVSQEQGSQTTIAVLLVRS